MEVWGFKESLNYKLLYLFMAWLCRMIRQISSSGAVTGSRPLIDVQVLLELLVVAHHHVDHVSSGSRIEGGAVVSGRDNQAGLDLPHHQTCEKCLYIL